jgi:hypothetical protein
MNDPHPHPHEDVHTIRPLTQAKIDALVMGEEYQRDQDTDGDDE